MDFMDFLWLRRRLFPYNPYIRVKKEKSAGVRRMGMAQHEGH
jgi:hypothetical protein